MNIHFNDQELFERLKSSALIRLQVGSIMYGLEHTNSDTDYLYILPTSDNELNSFQQCYHQLQYNEDGIDHNFTNIHNFIRNTIKGDSTINFECINSEQIIGTELNFLHELKSIFNNYKIIRSYLGLAKRDEKYYDKETTNEGRHKKIIHVIRGYYFARTIVDNTFTLRNSDVLLEAIKIRKITDVFELKKTIKDYLTKVSDLRELLNKINDDGSLGLAQYMEPNNQSILDEKLGNFINSDFYKAKKSILGSLDLSKFYNANENWVNY